MMMRQTGRRSAEALYKAWLVKMRLVEGRSEAVTRRTIEHLHAHRVRIHAWRRHSTEDAVHEPRPTAVGIEACCSTAVLEEQVQVLHDLAVRERVDVRVDERIRRRRLPLALVPLRLRQRGLRDAKWTGLDNLAKAGRGRYLRRRQRETAS